MFSFILGICVGVELLDHSVIQCFNFLKIFPAGTSG